MSNSNQGKHFSPKGKCRGVFNLAQARAIAAHLVGLAKVARGRRRSIGSVVRAMLVLVAMMCFGLALVPTMANAAVKKAASADPSYSSSGVVVCNSAVAGKTNSYTQATFNVHAHNEGLPANTKETYSVQNSAGTVLGSFSATTDANGNFDATNQTVTGTFATGVNYNDGIGDANGNYLVSSSITLTGDCAPANQAPVAKLTVTPNSGDAPLAITADASKSTDDHGIVGYNFAWGDGTSTGYQSGSTATHTLTNAGIDTVTVTVKDASGLTNSTTAKVTVNTPAPPPGCVTLTTANVASYGTYVGSMTTATVRLKDRSGGYCNDWAFAKIRYTLDNPPATWSQTTAQVATKSVGKSGLTATATVDATTCGQTDGDEGTGPNVGDKLTGPGQGYESNHKSLSEIFGGPNSYFLDKSGCGNTPPTPATPTAKVKVNGCACQGDVNQDNVLTVTNTADATKAAVTYSYTVTSTAIKTPLTGTITGVADGQDGTADLKGLAAGTYTVSVIGSDGTKANTTFTVETCKPTPPVSTVTFKAAKDCFNNVGIAATGTNFDSNGEIALQTTDGKHSAMATVDAQGNLTASLSYVDASTSTSVSLEIVTAKTGKVLYGPETVAVTQPTLCTGPQPPITVTKYVCTLNGKKLTVVPAGDMVVNGVCVVSPTTKITVTTGKPILPGSLPADGVGIVSGSSSVWDLRNELLASGALLLLAAAIGTGFSRRGQAQE